MPPHDEDQQSQELRERNYSTFIRGGAGINFGHEKWWPFGVTGLFDGGPNSCLIIIYLVPQESAKYACVHFSVPTSKTTPGRATTERFWKPASAVVTTRLHREYLSSAGVVYFLTS